LERLTVNSGIDVSASLSPDGKQMVFCSDRSGTPQIWIQEFGSGRPPRRLTYDGKYNTSPEWSPRANQIVYAGTTEDGKTNLFLTRPDGMLINTLLTLGEGNNESPSFSPDGRRVVFSSNRGKDRRYHIYTMSIDGSRVRQLTSGDANDTMPAWSPRRRKR
jgi:TolB protein